MMKKAKKFFSELFKAIRRVPGAIRRTWKWNQVLRPLSR